MVPITPVQYRISTQHGRPPDLGQITPNTAFKTHILVFQKPNTAFKTRIEKSQVVTVTLGLHVEMYVILLIFDIVYLHNETIVTKSVVQD